MAEASKGIWPHTRDQVDMNERRPTKRSRVTRACDQCRANREKCDGLQPECNTCASLDRGCSYNELPKKRGIQPHYIRTLELTLAWIFQNFPAAEAKLSGSLPDPEGNAQRLINGVDPDASESLHQSWRNGITNKQIDQMLSGLPIDLAAPLPNIPQSYPSPSVQQSLDAATSSEAVLHTPGIDALIAPEFLPTVAFENAEQDSRERRDSHLKLPTNAWNLVDFYFAFTHSWLPMTEKHSILKLLYTYPPAGLQRSQITIAEHAELWSILALASFQISGAGENAESVEMLNIATSLLPDNNSYEVPHIKAMLLLALIHIQKDQLLAAWLRVGTVVRILLLFNLLQTLGTTDKWCRHIHLAAFVLENALAMHLRAPGHLTAGYIGRIGFVIEDGLDEWNNWTDPLAGEAVNTQERHPIMAFSTLNALVRKALQSTVHAAETGDLNNADFSESSVVFNLITNAALSQGRVQPSKIVAADNSNQATLISTGAPSAAPMNPEPNVQTHPLPQAIPTSDLHPHRTHPAPTTTPNGNGPQLPGSSHSFEALSVDLVSQSGHADNQVVGTASTLDLFEELATFDEVDATQGSQFLQNLGFAPDIDLAEFFGPDY